MDIAVNDFPEFEIRSSGPVSFAFSARGIQTFQEAFGLVKKLPYGRNENKNDLLTVLTDGCGTCSTKHALLLQLALEHKVENLQLVMGLFRMNARNTPEVTATLAGHNLQYIPEAHCYLKYEGQVLDATKEHSDPANFLPELLEEVSIVPEQITSWKVAYHRQYMEKWLKENKHITFTPAEIWNIREQCIRDLATINP